MLRINFYNLFVFQIIKALLDKGASWEAEDSRGRTPVEIGRINEQINVLNFRQEGSLNSNTEVNKY